MKILVTGGSGFVGSILVAELLNKGHQVRVLDNLMYSQISLVQYFIDENFEFIKGDIRNVDTVKRAVKNMDAILHLAALVGGPACNKNEEITKAINLHGTLNVVNARNKNQKLIFSSTGSVYGALDEICTEKSPTNPLSSYGITKLQGEKEVIRSGNSIVYRFATGFGLSPRLRLDLMINDFVFKALKNRYLVVYDKDYKRTFIHVKDMVRAFIFGIENFDDLKNEVYNVGSEKMNFTKEDIAELIRSRVQAEIYYTAKGIKDPDQRNYEVSYQKIRELGFETKINIEKGIDELTKGFSIVDIKNPYSNVD